MSEERPMGWNPDPTGEHALRWWNGKEWTDHTSDDAAATSGPTSKPDADESEDVPSGAILEIQASRFKGGRMLTPNRVFVFPDRVEEFSPHALRKKGTQTIRLEQVAQVAIARGLTWSDMSIESTGGHTIKIGGVKKDEAERAKQLITELAANVRRDLSTPVAPPPNHVDVADQLTKLAALRDQGILSDDEFLAQKAKLLL